MNSDAFFIENCYADNESVKCGVGFKKFFYKSQKNEFKAVFPIFLDEKLKEVNSFILKLINEYSTYSSKTYCKKIILTFTSKKNSVLSLVLEVFYREGKKVKGLNFDLTTMMLFMTNSFFKVIKIKKKYLKDIAKKLEKNITVIYDSAHIFNDKLRFFCIKKSNKELVEFKIPI